VSTLRPTTVRFIPGDAASPDELAIAALHLYAYTTAAGFVQPGTRVLDIGFGVCGVMGERVVSEAYAGIPGNRAYEIGPIVLPEFRRRGLAYATCAALIDECGRRGVSCGSRTVTISPAQ
jgi:GNAT superfamily N-acetyltransferase